MCVCVCVFDEVETGALNAAGWRKVNRKQKVPMEEVCDICQDLGWAADSATPPSLPLRRLRVTHRAAVAKVVTTR